MSEQSFIPVRDVMTAKPLVIDGLATVAQAWRDRTVDSDSGPRGLSVALTLAVVATAALATWWMYLTGEEGARITWSSVVQ